MDVDRLLAAHRRPHLVILHGFEGSSKRGYVVNLLREAAQRQYGAFALNFRSCSGELNRALKSYNSGDFSDLSWALERIRSLGVSGPLLGVGFSLGASVLLNYLAATSAECAFHAAAAVSTPFDLQACVRNIDGEGLWPRVYREWFLRSLRSKALAKAKHFPRALDWAAAATARGIEAYDDHVTAPSFGFKDARAYYAASSTRGQLGAIRRPTLLLSSIDDPLVPSSCLPSPETLAGNRHLVPLFVEHGGHLGFVDGSLHRPGFWAERQVLRFLACALNADDAQVSSSWRSDESATKRPDLR
jgi:predicted alpha/beta-fold hydrolase